MPPDNDAARVGAILLAVPGQTSAGIDLLRSPLLDRPLAAWALLALRDTPAIAEIVLLVEPERVDEARSLVASVGIPGTRVVVADGSHNGNAIRAGLDALTPSMQLVIVQEAARPLVTLELLAEGLAAFVGPPDLVAACAASPMKETVKRVRDGVVTETLDRSRLVLLQTPMVFERAALDQACRAGGASDHFSGLLSVLRSAGGRIATFPGGAENLAVAAPDDLVLAERLLRARRPS